MHRIALQTCFLLLPAFDMQFMTNKTATNLMMAGLLAALSIVVYLWGSVVNQEAAFAAANEDHANPVAHIANANQGYIESCKEVNTAKQCATGPLNNGEFTSLTAHGVNGPP